MATNTTMVNGKKRIRTVLVNNDEEAEKLLRPWSDLPQEILELIKKRILFAGQQNFPVVCKSWSSVGIFPPAKQIPWLIVFDETDHENTWSSCKPIDPTSKKTYTIDMKAIKEKKKIKDFKTMKVHESKYGWLLISSQLPYSTTTTSLFLYSPFYKDREKKNVIELPVLNYSNISLATFTSNPLKEDCKFFTITPCSQTSGVVISTYVPGDKRWCSLIHWYSNHSLAEIECWTFSQGIFYGASRNSVGKIDLNRNGCFKSLGRPPLITLYDGGKLHIVKSDGDEELFLIFERNLRTSNKMLCHFVTYIYRYDLSLRIWERVDRLGDSRVLFIGDGYNCVREFMEKREKGYRIGYFTVRV